jgi:glycosyltransferase involved in cell wall biosynthesis
MEIHQLLPNMAFGDAISNHALELKRLLKSWGYASEIYAQTRERFVLHQCKSINDYQICSDSKKSVVIYHYSIGADRVTQVFQKTVARKILIYHNMTPHQYFQKYNQQLYLLLKHGREDLSKLSKLTNLEEGVDLCIGDSDYNVQELRELGFRKIESLPILLDFKAFEKTPPDPNRLKYLTRDWTTFLFTGRVVPNKAIHDVIRAFAYYQRNIERRSRLLLVGSIPFGAYYQELLLLAQSLGVEENVFFSFHVKFSELVAYYHVADLFLCMSDHEGFCVPLLEAMYFNIPIVAYAATAVPQTLGSAGILVKQKDPEVVAELCYLLMKNLPLRNRVIQNQKKRLEDFDPKRVSQRYRELIEQVAYPDGKASPI